MTKARCEICERNFKNEESLKMHNHSKHRVSEESSSETFNFSKKYLFFGVAIIAIILIFTFSGSSGKYDAFAQCLSDEGFKMYGAYWCPHCLDQKSLFGGSWKNIDYVECSLPNKGGQTSICIQEGIESYPTWEFADGSKNPGLYQLEALSEISGCALLEDAE